MKTYGVVPKTKGVASTLVGSPESETNKLRDVPNLNFSMIRIL
jgi:hypothetical protein